MMSVGRANEKKTSTRTGYNPLVICIDKDDQAEMGNWQDVPNGSQPEETISQEFEMVDSPIMFSTQGSSLDAEMIESENDGNEDDCLEIIDTRKDDIKQVKKSVDQNHTSSAKPSKGKICLSLGKKRKTCQQDEADCRRDGGVSESQPKQRRLKIRREEDEEENSIVADEEKPEASSEKEASTVQPILLLRSYNCTHTVCRTLQEADKRDLYFAPHGVAHSRYSKVIVRKLENYRQRLHHAQSRVPIRHPCGSPIEPMTEVHVPTIQRRPGPSHSRVTRASVLRKNTKEVNPRTARDTRKVKKDSNEQRADIFGTTSKATEAASCDSTVDEPVEVEVIDDYNQNKRTTTPSPTYTYSPSLASNGDDDVERIDNGDDVSLFKEETGIRIESSLPAVLRLREKPRRAILEDSDDEEFDISFRGPPLTTPAENKKQESVIVSRPTSEADTDSQELMSQELTSQENSHECPMCFKMFPKDRIETHAAICLGLSQTSTRSTSRDVIDEEEVGIIANTTTKQSNESAGSLGIVEDCEMSPTIKIRTPTKVKELKLLTPSVAVRNLANDFFSQPQTSERVQMFGVNVTLSPKKTHSLSDTKKNAETSRFTSVKLRNQSKCEESTQAVKRSDDVMATKDESRRRIPNFIETTRNLLQKSCPTNEPKTNKRPWDDISLSEDFMPLICDSSDSRIVTAPDDNLPSKTPFKPIRFATSVLSSDEEIDNGKVVTAGLKVLSGDKEDDLSALDTMVTSYKGRKTKQQNTFSTNQKKRPKKQLNPEEDESLEYCSFCEKFVSADVFAKHMDEEIVNKEEERQREDPGVSVLASRSSGERHSPVPQTRRGSTKSRGARLIGKNGRELLLPDLAVEIPQDNNENTSGSSRRTFGPLDRGLNSNGEYFDQFPFTGEPSAQAQERQPKKRTKLIKVVKGGELRRKKK